MTINYVDACTDAFNKVAQRIEHLEKNLQSGFKQDIQRRMLHAAKESLAEAEAKYEAIEAESEDLEASVRFLLETLSSFTA